MRRTRGAAAVLAGLLLAILPAAGPAWAHDGKTQAGGGRRRRHRRHRPGPPRRRPPAGHAGPAGRSPPPPTGGRTVGPLQLEPAGEGQGFYTSGPILAPGSWRVTVRAPAPHASKVTVEVRARAAQSAPAPVGGEAGRARGGPSWRWWPVGLGVLAVLVIVTMVLRRRRRALTKLPGKEPDQPTPFPWRPLSANKGTIKMTRPEAPSPELRPRCHTVRSLCAVPGRTGGGSTTGVA